MSITVMARLGGLALLLAGCSGSGDVSLMQTCAAVDGNGNVYQAANPEMLDALEQAMAQCETAAADPSTCVARGCGGAR